MDQEKIAKLIKKIRSDNDLTQKQLADKLNVTYQAVSKWENGKSIPDIETLKIISKKFDIPMSTLFEEESRFNIYLHLIIISTVVGIIYLFFINDNTYNFEEIGSACDNFNVSGVVAYNKDRTSLFISDVDFCGDKDDTIYNKISCNLVEENNDATHVINECGNGENINLESYVKDIKFRVDDFTVSCNSFKTAKLYLEIKGDLENKTTTFKVPIKLNDSCDN